MEKITSFSNEKVKAVKKLKDKKFRRESGLFVVEGFTIVGDMPSSVVVSSFFVEEGVLADVEQALSRFDAPIYLVNSQILASMSDTVSPSGIIAVLEQPKPTSLSGGNLLVLDGVSDSGNLGTLIRTAVAADFRDILLIGTVDPFSNKVVRSSMSGIFKVNLIEVSADEAVQKLKNYDSYALDMDGLPIAGVKAKKPTAIILGNEAHGVSEKLMRAADHTVSIPMKNGLESLNVAVAGAIAMYNLTIF